MANDTIDDLPLKSGALSGTEKIEIDDGASKSVTAQQIADLAGAGSALIPVRVVTGTASALQASDGGGAIHGNNAALISLTIPLNSTTPLPVGYNTLVRQMGVGAVQIVAPAGVTLHNGFATAKTAGQFKGSIALHQIAADEWYLDGTVAAA